MILCRPSALRTSLRTWRAASCCGTGRAPSSAGRTSSSRWTLWTVCPHERRPRHSAESWSSSLETWELEGWSARQGRWTAADPECSTVKIQILPSFSFTVGYLKKEKKKYEWWQFCHVTPRVPCSILHNTLNVQKLCRLSRKCFYLSIKMNKRHCVDWMYTEYSNVGNERQSWPILPWLITFLHLH